VDRQLTWDDTFEIARLLSQRKLNVNLRDVSLGNILEWTRELPEFSDDTQNVADQILIDIFCEWLEEDLNNE
jgi:FeS assembly protein IscX